MRKIKMCIWVVFISLISVLPVVAQECYVSSYQNSYFNKEFEIRAKDFKNKNSEIVYIGIESEYASEAYIEVWARNLDKFRNSLVMARDKFLEWQEIAVENDVEPFQKKMDIKFPFIGTVWYSTKWWYNYATNLVMSFKILSSGRAIAIWSPKVKAASNQFVDQQLYFIFQSEDDFNNLIEELDLQIITEKVRNAKLNKELFK